MKKQTIKLKESQLRNLIKEALNELDWKTYANAENKRLAQGKYANANELSNMAKNRFDDEYNNNYRYDTLGAKLADKHSKTFNSTFIPTEKPSLQGRNEKGEELFRNNGKYYNSRRGLTTPEKFFKDKEMSDTFNTATQELDNYNNGNYDYTPDKGWHLKESKLNKIIKKSIKKCLNEAYDIDDDAYYGGGLPEPAQHAMTYTPEKEVAEICEQMRPYVDKLADIFNNYSPTVQGVDDKVFTLLNGFDELPKLAKFFSTTEID